MTDDKILKRGCRILRPHEYEQLRGSIPKTKHKLIIEALFFSGARYSEIAYLKQHKQLLKSDYIIMPSQKKRAKQKERYILLNARGQQAIEYFIDGDATLPSYSTMNENLQRWAKNAKLDPEGITIKTFRKTWESWLCASYPHSLVQIFMSQGHSQMVSITHYLNIPFTKQDKQRVQKYTQGWGNIDDS